MKQPEFGRRFGCAGAPEPGELRQNIAVHHQNMCISKQIVADELAGHSGHTDAVGASDCDGVAMGPCTFNRRNSCAVDKKPIGDTTLADEMAKNSLCERGPANVRVTEKQDSDTFRGR